MCKLIMRKKIGIFSNCCFTRKAISLIACDCGLVKCVLPEEKNILKVLLALNDNSGNDYVFIHIQSNVNVIVFLRIIQGVINSVSRPRIIVMVDNVHAPTLKLLRSMDVRFILSQRESLITLLKILCSSAISHYMSDELHTVMKNIYPATVWGKEWGPFDGVQHLTPTEIEIVLDLLQGMSPQRMSQKRFVSVKTISTHKHNALRKMGLKGLNEFFISPRCHIPRG